jgi:hypothetical protein
MLTAVRRVLVPGGEQATGRALDDEGGRAGVVVWPKEEVKVVVVHDAMVVDGDFRACF